MKSETNVETNKEKALRARDLLRTGEVKLVKEAVKSVGLTESNYYYHLREKGKQKHPKAAVSAAIRGMPVTIRAQKKKYKKRKTTVTVLEVPQAVAVRPIPVAFLSVEQVREFFGGAQ